jgi:hypothetical protein
MFGQKGRKKSRDQASIYRATKKELKVSKELLLKKKNSTY